MPTPSLRAARPVLSLCLFAGFCLTLRLSVFGQGRDLLNAGGGHPPFDITKRSVPKEAILEGGPPKDGIPALDRPRFISAEKADRFLQDREEVIGVFTGGQARAYPLRVMVWHELVNDEIEGRAVAVSYCPLNGAAAVYHSQAGEKQLTFGVTGKLYHSTVVLYDRQTQSLWSQVTQEAIAGSSTGMKLEMIPSLTTTWKHWKSLHPETLVLSSETGFRRDYNQNPYAAYQASDQIMFPVPRNVKSKLRNKERVLGLEIDGVAKAYPFSRLKKRQTPFEDEVGQTKVQVHFDRQTKTASVTDLHGHLLPAFNIYWFVWQAFHPGTLVLE
ncbi:MAG: DUF3179 domain-containing protein [Acidobacteriota bacterium]